MRRSAIAPLLAMIALGQEQTEQQREEERRRQKQQQDRARQQLDQARIAVNRVEGKILMSGGGSPPDRVAIALICGDQTVDRQFTDSRGRFTLTVSASPAVTDASTSSGRALGAPGLNPGGKSCLIRAVLLGFQADPIRLENPSHGSEPIYAQILLSPTEAPGYTFSATTPAASRDARKAYDRGLQSYQRQKLTAAESELRRAVELHPRFAIAWYALGRVYSAERRPSEARKALEQAVAADAKYFNPYPMLVQLALDERRWEDLAHYTQTAIQLNPLFSADIYLLSAQANLKLGRLDPAEKHAREAVSMDTQRKLPVALQLLGTILAAKGKNQEAARQLRAFLEAIPAFPDAPIVRAEIERLERQ